MKRSTLIIFFVLVVLASAVAVLAILNAPDGDIESGTITITKGGGTVRVFTMDEIVEMDYVEKEIVSSDFKSDKDIFRGVPLRTLISNADSALIENASMIIVRTEDGLVSAFPIDEITESDSVFLAYLKNGGSLGSLENGGDGPFRIITAGDEFRNRCAKYVYEIEVK